MVAAITQFTDQNFQKVILYWPGVEREEKRPPCRDCQEWVLNLELHGGKKIK